MRNLAVVTVLAATAIGGDAASACGLGLWGTGAGVGVSKYRAGTYGYGAGVGYGVGVRRGWGYRGVDVGRPGIGVGRPVARAAAFGPCGAATEALGACTGRPLVLPAERVCPSVS